MKFLITLLFDFSATWTEGYRDRHGDAHPNSDWKMRGLLCLIAGLMSALIDPRLTYLIDVARHTSISALLFSALFPYWINYIHLKNKVTAYIIPFGLMTRQEKFDHIVNHMSDTAWPDRDPSWRSLGWKRRMAINATLLCLALILFLL